MSAYHTIMASICCSELFVGRCGVGKGEGECFKNVLNEPPCFKHICINFVKTKDSYSVKYCPVLVDTTSACTITRNWRNPLHVLLTHCQTCARRGRLRGRKHRPYCFFLYRICICCLCNICRYLPHLEWSTLFICCTKHKHR